jgi:glucose-1-phosphate adenylyltransferase
MTFIQAPLGVASKVLPRVKRIVDMSRVGTIILGGGMGTRLYPLTLTRCKPAICFGGTYKLLDIPMSNALNSGLNKIYILTQFLSASLHQHILKTYRMEPHSPGFIEILSAEQKPSKAAWYQGTADAIRQNIEYLFESDEEYLLILSGDQLYQMQFDEMLAFAQESDADLVIAALQVHSSKAKRMGVLKINQDQAIVDFIEKPQTQDDLDWLENEQGSFLGSMGIYLFKKKALLSLLQEDPGHDFGNHLIPAQIQKGKTVAYIFNGYWEDIGTIKSFYEANIALTSPNPLFNLHHALYPIHTMKQALPPPLILNSAIKNSLVCEGSIIEAKTITNSIIGPNSSIETGTNIDSSYLFGHHKTRMTIGKNCEIKKALIDKNVHIGNHVKLINKNNYDSYEKGHLFIRDGIIIVTKGAVIPDHFEL